MESIFSRLSKRLNPRRGEVTTSVVNVDLRNFREREVLEETRSILKVTANHLAIPLFLVFWLADYLAYPDRYLWLGLVRLTIIPTCFLVQWAIPLVTSYIGIQWLALAYSMAMAQTITLIIFISEDYSGFYYAGLNLVAVGTLSFIPWDRRFYVRAGLGIFAPYYCMLLIYLSQWDHWRIILSQGFFVVGTLVISYVIRYFNEELRRKELKARIQLAEEVRDREKTIRIKTHENVNLSRLSSQFSPQVIGAVRDGHLNLDSAQKRTDICCLFIDIVDSTRQINQGHEETFHLAIGEFMEGTMKILLKYNITIDKFLGDGVLAFSNAPLAQADFTDRILGAGLEIRDYFAERKTQLTHIWDGDFQLRMGISVGSAQVGFYGSSKTFRAYTAIGSVVHRASRLCNAALPNQILMDAKAFAACKKDLYRFKALPYVHLKGFDEPVSVYAIERLRHKTSADSVIPECPDCGLVLHLDTNQHGQYVFRCRECHFVLDEAQSINVTKVSA